MKKNYMTPTLAVIHITDSILAGSFRNGENPLGTDPVDGSVALSKRRYILIDEEEEYEEYEEYEENI